MSCATKFSQHRKVLRRLSKQSQEFLTRYKDEKPAVVGLIVVLIFVSIAILAPAISPYDAYEISRDVLASPSVSHLAGTDSLGRDIWTRLLFGTRVSLTFAFGVAGLSAVLGIIIGAIPGYYGGLVDDGFSRFFDVFSMIPRFFLILLVVALLGTNILFTMLIVALTSWPSNAKIMRAQVLSLKSREFVLASEAIGASTYRVLFLHIIPNGISPVVSNSTLQMGYAVLIEASLSFLGLGDVAQVSWGQILFAGQMYFHTAWWMAVFPGLAIMTLVLAFNMIGDGLIAVINPRLREQAFVT